MNTELKIQHVSALMGCSYLSCPPENETERMWSWGGGEVVGYWEEWEGGETVLRMYCMREEYMFNKKKIKCNL